MQFDIAKLWADATVTNGLRRAWLDSNPGNIGGHEEGGFITANVTGALAVHRWPEGQEKRIVPPAHKDCRYENCDIIASFHTHPHIGPDFQQAPSATDRNAVRTDTELKGPDYLGEIVISNHRLYLVDPFGMVQVLGATDAILKLP